MESSRRASGTDMCRVGPIGIGPIPLIPRELEPRQRSAEEAGVFFLYAAVRRGKRHLTVGQVVLAPDRMVHTRKHEHLRVQTIAATATLIIWQHA